MFGTFDWADRPPRNLSIEELKEQEILGPGEAYKYNDVRVNLLSFSLLNVLQEPLPNILKREIMDPIELQQAGIGMAMKNLKYY